MKILTQLASALVISAVMTTSAITHADAPADMSFAFDDAHSLQVQDMNTQQMQETEGALEPITIGAFVVGVAWGYFSGKGGISLSF